MLARLLYGGRYTLAMCLIAALARVGIGTLVGMLAGWYPASTRAIAPASSAGDAGADPAAALPPPEPPTLSVANVSWGM